MKKKNLYEFVLKYDFINDKKTKSITKHPVLAETKDQTCYLDGGYEYSEFMGIVYNDIPEHKTSIKRSHRTIGEINSNYFTFEDIYDEIEVTTFRTSDRDREKIFSEMEAELNKVLKENYAEAEKFSNGIKFYDVKTQYIANR